MKSDNNHISSFLNGAGFYIVLFLAVAVIAASGYFIYRTISGQNTANDPIDSQTTVIDQEHQVPDIEVHEDVDTPAPVSEDKTAPVSGTVEVSTTTPKAEQMVDTRVVEPLSGDTVTPFSMDTLLYNETMADWRTHNGVDITADEGATVVAAAAGKVTSVVDDYWMGTTVTIACGDGYELVYASLQSSPQVSVGDQVACGDVIGAVGSTALLEESAGAHLHFAVTRNGVAMDPMAYLSKNN